MTVKNVLSCFSDLALGFFPRWWLPNFQRPEISATRRPGIGDGSGEGHKCSGCGKTYLWRSTLTRHKQYECGGKEPMHQCPHCSYRARQRDCYDGGNQVNGTVGAAFQCPNCGRSYRWRDNLRRHQRVECGKEASFWCSLCPFRSKHKHSLLRHLHNRHFTTAAAAEAAVDLAIASVEPPSNNSSAQNLDGSAHSRVNNEEYQNSF
ncbi:zinc finger protein 2-like [Thrips palmi]|uniref:Zinc finger protein 2-like n=1 Tax=Thrips palmi TaxID=161013 RepID=A0A6P9A0E0_THRPL|nr:zinc finger protein 2-like [Thrips palmi]